MEKISLQHVWPEWKIVRQIGRGSFGSVYEAVRTDHSIENRAAVKVITIPQSESEIANLRSEGLSEGATKTYLQGVVDDFVQEIQMMISLKGLENIVSVEDFKVIEKSDRIGWDIFIRMELLKPFNEYLVQRSAQMSEREVLKLGIDICTALEYCSQRNIIHRDVKPENIFVNSFGNYKLGDFGIARTMEHTSGNLSQKGTYSYMAPEIESGTNYDPTVDLYSLGLVLYRLVNNNRLPFLFTEEQVLNPNERMIANRRRLNGEPLPYPEAASPEFADVILRACSYYAEDRFRNATALKTALKHLLEMYTQQNASAGRNAYEYPQQPNGTTRVRTPNGGNREDPPGNRQNPSGNARRPIENPPQWNTASNTQPAPKKKSKLMPALYTILAIVLISGGILLGKLISDNLLDHSEEEAAVASSSDEEERVVDRSVDEVVVASSSVEEKSAAAFEPEEEPDWQTAYIDYFNDALENSYSDLDGFMLFDADGDEVPELLLWYEEHASMGLVSWYDGKLYENALGEYCSTVDNMYGITYYPKGKEIYSQYISPWDTGDPVLSILKKGRLERTAKVQSKKNAVNYTQSDSYQPTAKNFEKHVMTWDPASAFSGRKPVTKTPTPKPTPKATPKPAAPEPIPAQPSGPSNTTLYIINPNDGLTLRDYPDYFDGGKIFEIHGNTPLTYLGQVQQGYGSDSAIHNWYLVQISDVYGWVRSDLITPVDNGYYVASDPTGMNMRSSSNINSGIAGTVFNNVRLAPTGKTGQGIGSDGANHTWYYVKIADSLQGWVRGDLTTG